MRETIVGVISILTAYKVSKLMMILFKGFANFLISSDDKITRLSGSLINDIFFSFPSISVFVISICGFIFFYFILQQLIDYFFE